MNGDEREKKRKSKVDKSYGKERKKIKEKFR